MNLAELITPKSLIETYGVDGLCKTADDYYRKVNDWNFLLAKPFSNPHMAYLMARLGAFLPGMRLAPGMTVLDFGAGTCWLSRILAQMGCKVFALDPSETALNIGRELCQRLPLIGPMALPPTFQRFDGYRIPLPDQSVDRIICFDSFHHVPNTEEILQEFGRITKAGAIIGMCEPIGSHSSSGASQHEMGIHKVLENDLSIESIHEALKSLGFDRAHMRLSHSEAFSIKLEDRKNLLSKNRFFRLNKVEREIISDAMNVIRNLGIVHFQKGAFKLDSRFPEGLRANIKLQPGVRRLRAGEVLSLELEISNTGGATWLHHIEHHMQYGKTQVGFNLYNPAMMLVHQGFHTCALYRDIKAGESILMTVSLPLLPKGEHIVEVDLFSNEVAWFRQCGSESVTIRVTAE